LCILYNITNSWLLSSTGFDFNILWCDSENQEYAFSYQGTIEKMLALLPLKTERQRPWSNADTVLFLLLLCFLFFVFDLAG